MNLHIHPLELHTRHSELTPVILNYTPVILNYTPVILNLIQDPAVERSWEKYHRCGILNQVQDDENGKLDDENGKLKTRRES